MLTLIDTRPPDRKSPVHYSAHSQSPIISQVHGAHCRLLTRSLTHRRTVQIRHDIRAALCEKVPYGLSRCHTKRRTGARGRACNYFGIPPTLKKKKKKKKKIQKKF